MITLHPTSTRVSEGFVPMITMRNTKGQMRGSMTPQGVAREFRTFSNAMAAEIEARVIALRCASDYPNALRVSL
jgi:hypothetical protein